MRWAESRGVASSPENQPGKQAPLGQDPGPDETAQDSPGRQLSPRGRTALPPPERERGPREAPVSKPERSRRLSHLPRLSLGQLLMRPRQCFRFVGTGPKCFH